MILHVSSLIIISTAETRRTATCMMSASKCKLPWVCVVRIVCGALYRRLGASLARYNFALYVVKRVRVEGATNQAPHKDMRHVLVLPYCCLMHSRTGLCAGSFQFVVHEGTTSIAIVALPAVEHQLRHRVILIHSAHASMVCLMPPT